jgi:hypothetical protein
MAFDIWLRKWNTIININKTAVIIFRASITASTSILAKTPFGPSLLTSQMQSRVVQGLLISRSQLKEAGILELQTSG